MKLFVTGATGLLGRHLVQTAHAAGHTVAALTRRPAPAITDIATIVIGEVTTLAATDIPPGTDAVIHMATGNAGERDEICRIAVDGTLATLRAARDAGVARFIHVSSMSVYPGKPARDAARIDGRALEPLPERRGVYAESKTLADTALQDALKNGEAGAMAIDIVRPGLVYGQEMGSPLAGTAAVVPLGIAVGLGRRRGGMPYLDIADLSAGLVALAATPVVDTTPRIFDILSGPAPDKEATVDAFTQLTGRGGCQLWLPRFAMLGAAWGVEGLFRLKRQRKDLPYKVARIYDFDPKALDATPFWQAVGDVPTGKLAASMRDALTLDRMPAPPPEFADGMRAHARALSEVGTITTAGATEPLVIVGAGRIVEEMHLPALAAAPGYRPVAVVDINAALAERIASRLDGVRAYATLAEVPDDTLAGATAVLATPGFTHAALATQLLERGASLLLEKPAAVRRGEFAAMRDAADRAARPVTVIQNYRLRPNSRALWRFLAKHDVGAPVAAHVTFHSGRILGEAARWSHAEKANRVLLFELAIHFLDLALQVTGRIESVDTCRVVDRAHAASTVQATGQATTASGAPLLFDLALAGTAQRAGIVIEFERSAVALDFFPEGFRVLPTRRNPIDEAAAATGRFTGFVWQKLRPRPDGVERRAVPHRDIYSEHLRRLRSPDKSSPFALDGVADTMTSLFALADRVYDGD